jgi:hypothetical protein
MSVRMKTRTLKREVSYTADMVGRARDAQILDEKDAEEVHEQAACN